MDVEPIREPVTDQPCMVCGTVPAVWRTGRAYRSASRRLLCAQCWVDNAERQTGRTTRLLELAVRTGALFIVHNAHMADVCANLLHDMRCRGTITRNEEIRMRGDVYSVHDRSLQYRVRSATLVLDHSVTESMTVPSWLQSSVLGGGANG